MWNPFSVSHLQKKASCHKCGILFQCRIPQRNVRHVICHVWHDALLCVTWLIPVLIFDLPPLLALPLVWCREQPYIGKSPIFCQKSPHTHTLSKSRTFSLCCFFFLNTTTHARTHTPWNNNTQITRTQTCTHPLKHTHTEVCLHGFSCVCVCVFLCVCVRAWVCVCMCVCARARVCVSQGRVWWVLQAGIPDFTWVQHTATRHSTLQHATAHCSALQHTAIHSGTLQHTAAYCHSAAHCSILYCEQDSRFLSVNKNLKNKSTNTHLLVLLVRVCDITHSFSRQIFIRECGVTH